MGGKARGHIAVRRRGGDTRYALRFSSVGNRYHLALGSEREGWNPRLAERALLALGAGFVAGLGPDNHGRRRDRSGG